MFFKGAVKFVEITAPTPNADDEIFVFFGMLHCIKQYIAVDAVELQLMSAEMDERLDKCRHLGDAVAVAKDGIVDLKR